MQIFDEEMLQQWRVVDNIVCDLTRPRFELQRSRSSDQRSRGFRGQRNSRSRGQAQHIEKLLKKKKPNNL